MLRLGNGLLDIEFLVDSQLIYACMHIHGLLAPTISVEDEAYEALLGEKTDKERKLHRCNLNQIIRKSGKIADCFGAWKMTDKEEAIRVELAKGWNLKYYAD